MSIDTTASQKTALEFKSTSLNVPVLILTDNNLTYIEHQLKEKIAQAPEFFRNSPLLVDLQTLNSHDLEIDPLEIVQLLRKYDFLSIGIRGGTDLQNKAAIKGNVAVHSSRSSQVSNKPQHPPKNILPDPPDQGSGSTEQPLENKLITQPVRSGQRVYAKGDLIITATVSAGAEIMAEGNIHVYGSLRGRALAGVQGNTSSRIFCSDLLAELVSIAGNYQVSDELEESIRHKPVQIYLQNQSLIIKKT